MPTIETFFHTGLRGIFHLFKKAYSTIFPLRLGFLLCLLFQLADEKDVLSKEEIREFKVIFLIFVFGSAILYLIFRTLHKSWVRRQLKQSKIDFLEQLNKEGVITLEAFNQAKAKLA